MTQAPSIQAGIELLFGGDATPDVQWAVQAATLDEQLNEPYTLTLKLATDTVGAEPVKLLGQPVHLTVIRGAAARMVTGIVSSVKEGSTSPLTVSAYVVVRPALDALRHRVNTRIFQEKTVPQILEQVLGEGLRPYKRSLDNRLSRTYRPCDYRVQYDESDFAFCERLMEEEGIVYWFEVEGEAELMVLADDDRHYGAIESIHDAALQFAEYTSSVGGHEYVGELFATSQVRPTKLATRHHDWARPSFAQDGASNDEPAGDTPHGAFVSPPREVYEHDEAPLTSEPGGTTYAADKDDQVRIRREAMKHDARVSTGWSTVFGMRVGATFTLGGHPRADLDGEYLVTSVTHDLAGGGLHYRNDFWCLPSDVSFRPRRVTPRPRIHSIQTATVVGPAGEEIHTDEHGRIKVQFHWDRLGARDEHSSCWVRVMQPWAGPGWGFVFIPRIGMEVVVNFVDGDPDRPLVMGSVYNGDNAPPYPLPAEKTKSTIKTNSSLGGGGFNELRFEDKAGSEEIYTHAQKDYNEVVEHDHNTLVHNDQTNTVDKNQTEVIHVDQSLTVDNNRTKVVKADQTATVLGNDTETVAGNRMTTLRSNRQVSVMMNDNLSVLALKATEVGLNYAIGVGVDYLLEAGSSITLKTGDSKLTMKSDGTIKIEGVKIMVDGASLVRLTAPDVERNT
jgi:type VI secretion system secreted protein VgrG